MSEQHPLSATLASLLEQAKMRPSQLAEVTGISRSYISELLNGRRHRLTRTTRERLARALNCRPTRLGTLRRDRITGRWTT